MVGESFSSIHARDVEEVFYLVEHAVADKDIPHEASAVGVGLDEDASLAVAGIVAIFHKDVLHAGTHLGADDYGMKALEVAMADDDVLRGSSVGPAVVVATALDGYIVVAIVEMDVLYQDVARALGVYAVVVDELGIIADASADDVLALQEMDAPERGVGDEDVFDGDALAAVELYEMGAQEVALAKLSLADAHALVVHVARALLGTLLPRLPGGEGLNAVAVDGALADDGDVVEAIAIDERRIVMEVGALPAGVDDGQVVVGLWREAQHGTFLQFQADIIDEVDGAVEQVGAGGYYDSCPTLLAGGAHGFVEGWLAVGGTIAAGSQFGDVQRGDGHRGASDDLQDGVAGLIHGLLFAHFSSQTTGR